MRPFVWAQEKRWRPGRTITDVGMALRDILRRRASLVANGAKRKSTGRRLAQRTTRMTHKRHNGRGRKSGIALAEHEDPMLAV